MADGQDKMTAGTKAKTPITMTKDDRKEFFDLQLQQAAASAEKASHGTGQALLASSKVAVMLAKAALTTPNPAPTPGGPSKSLQATLDGVYAKYFDLREVVDKDPASKAYSAEIVALLNTFTTRFQGLGWKPSKTVVEVHSREEAADKAGATSLSPMETRSLGVLYLREAREVLLAAWEKIQATGDLSALPAATSAMARAQGLLVHPALVGELGPIVGDVEMTEQVFGRVASLSDDPKKHAALQSFARYLDSISALVDRPAISGPKVGIAPKGKEDAKDKDKDKPANEVDPGAPRGEAPMHRADQRVYTRHVFLRDYNYEDEELGYVELRMNVMTTASGQVYCSSARAIDHINNKLSMGADIVSHSVRSRAGQNYCDIEFLVHVGGPNVTNTTEMGVEAKVGVEGVGEVGGSVKHSRSTTQANTEPFLRKFRIANGAMRKEVLLKGPNDVEVIDSSL